jgi:hypothetical protein
MSQNNVIDYVRNAWGVLVVLRALDLRAHSPMYPQLTDGPIADTALLYGLFGILITAYSTIQVICD